MNGINFLEMRNNSSLKKEINNIVDSYSNPYDILSELTQNSYDAIVRFIKNNGETIKEHSITIEVNCPKRLVRIKDSGVGIEATVVKDLIAPNGTDKENEVESVGEKGVGLTYAIFSCNNFHITTQYKTSYFEGTVENASIWRRTSNVPIPTLQVNCEKEISSTTDTYTEIILQDIDQYYNEEEDLFSLSPELLQYILRSKTIIGNFKAVFSPNSVPDIKVVLEYVDPTNKKNSYPVSFKYCLPEEFMSGKTINYDDFIVKAALYDRKQKSQKLRGKALIKKGSVNKYNREIRYYFLFAPSRSVWKDICDYNHLFTESSGNEKNYALSGGIYVATKGMPTGIVIENPTTGYSGYWSNCFMLIEDDSIVFDLGRKTVPSRTKGTLKEVAKELFNSINPLFKFFTSDPAITTTFNATVQQQQKAQCYEELKKIASLNYDKINYKKNPNEQEAAVVAIFHELIGAKVLKGYESLSTGYKQTYDLWATYRISEDLVGTNYREISRNGYVELPCVIEFKYVAQSILEDLNNDVKFFTDMDLLVCWDLDENAFAKYQVEVQQIPKDDVLFYGSNYKLVWPGSYNLGAASEKPVLALRQFIHDCIQEG